MGHSIIGARAEQATSAATIGAATIGAPYKGVATYIPAAVRSLAVEAARAAAMEENKGLTADAWACATLIADAVLAISESGTARSAVFDVAAAAAADEFKAARRAESGNADAKTWPAFASARSTLKNGLYFGAYEPGMSKSKVAAAVKKTKAAAAAAVTEMARQAGLLPSAAATSDAAELATALAAARAESAAAADEVAALQDTIRAMRESHAAEIERLRAETAAAA